MIPIVKIPQVVEHFAPYFKDLFTCSEYEQFQRYLSGLIISENKTVEGINRHFVVEVRDQSTLNRFLTDSKYEWEALNQRRLDFLQTKQDTQFKTTGKLKGVLGIDDTLLTHYGSYFDKISKLKDPHSKVIMWSHNLVNLYYSDDKIDYPVYQLLWEPPDIDKLVKKMDELSIFLNDDKRKVKDEKPGEWRDYILYARYSEKQFKHPELTEVYKTKLWLAKDLVEKFIDTYPDIDLPFCFDRWYTKPMLCDYISSENRTYVGLLEAKTLIEVKKLGKMKAIDFAKHLKKEQLEKDKIHFQKVGIHWRGKTTHFYAYTKIHNLPAFGKVRIVISYKKSDLSDETPYIIITNQLKWRAAGILSVYRRRWPVEVFHEEAKAEGLNKYQIRDHTAIYKHIALISLVYSLLHSARYDRGLISTLQQQLHQSIGDLMEGSVAHWRRVVKAQAFFNLIEWIAHSDQDPKNWKLVILPIIQTMTY